MFFWTHNFIKCEKYERMILLFFIFSIVINIVLVASYIYMQNFYFRMNVFLVLYLQT